ncbi:MAG: VCBS repeat-containing protein [Saprospiraceae bacterium]|nr:VCBS repeat-containing protein [Saprospiraceae bacterium]
MTKVAIGFSLICFVLQMGIGQVRFSQSGLSQELFSGMVMSAADINGDYQDDLLVLDQGRYLWAGYGTGKAHFIWVRIPVTTAVPLWSISVADIDRNGLADIVLGGDEPNFQVLYQRSQGRFEATRLNFPYFFSQAACFYDINKDGWIDLTICDDNAKTKVFENLSGTLKNNTAWIDLSMDPASNEAGNYGCQWSDFDQDGDGDLYISKCHPHAKDPRDPRRVNLFYKNDDQRFLEISDLMGIDCGDQSWVSVFGDINGDGRTDLMVANHYAPSKVYLQNHFGTYDDATIASGLDSKLAIFQMLLRDLDNDMDQDLILCGNGTEIWLNNGRGYFEQVQTGLTPFSSMVVGDFNEDGFLDLYGSYAYLINNISNIPDKLWINNGNENHWIKLGLKGNLSNTNGIGALIYIWTGGTMQYQEMLSGESYGIQNSLNLHFGLADHEEIDSVIIKWPSGRVDRYEQLSANQFYLITEGHCAVERQNLSPAIDTIVCLEQRIELRAEQLEDSMIWNIGIFGQTIEADSSGLYFFRIAASDGCQKISKTVSILLNPEEHPRLSHRYQQLICAGEEIQLSVPGYSNLIWENGSYDANRILSQDGIYHAMVKGLCSDWSTDSLKLTIVDLPVDPIIENVTLTGPGSATLISDQMNTEWFKSREDKEAIFVGDQFITPVLQNTTRFFARTFSVGDFDPVTGGPLVPEFHTAAYHAQHLNPRMEFKVFQDLILDSLTLYTDREAKRTIQLLDADWWVVQQQDVWLTPGKNRVFVGFELSGPNTTYFLTTSTDTNMVYLNSMSPRLQRSDLNVRYPIHLEDKLRIVRSQHGENYFYAFYEWTVRPKPHQCYSDWQEVIVQIEPSSLDDNTDLGGCRWWLADGMIAWENCANRKINYRLSDLLGRVIYEFHPGKHGFNLSAILGTGIYILTVTGDKGSISSYKITVH